ncbi:MAG: hypothetical protein ACJ8B6_06650 [Gemmatimonadales bacterium]
MTWQEFQLRKPALPDEPTLEQWQQAVADAERMIETEVIEADRQMARAILGDTLIQAGVFLGYMPPSEV